jgi:hypothetical protein
VRYMKLLLKFCSMHVNSYPPFICTLIDRMEELVSGLQGPPGLPGRGRPGRPGPPGRTGTQGRNKNEWLVGSL